MSINTPSSMAVGDFVLVPHYYDYHTLADLTTPTGTAVGGTWTSQTTSGTVANQMHVKLWSGVATTAGVQTVVVNSSTTDATHMPVLYVVDSTGVTITVVGAGQNTGNNTVSHVAPSITNALIDDLLICGVGESPFSGGSYTWPGAMTERSDVVVGTNSVASTATEVLTANGATGTRTATFSGTTEDFVAFSIVLRATSSGGGTLPRPIRRVRTAVTRSATY